MEQYRCYGCMNLKTQRPQCEHCGFDESTRNLSHQLPIGTVLYNQYVIGRVLGQGGFGITYLGWDQNLDRPVAIKEYFPANIVRRDASHSHTISITTGDNFFYSGRDRFLREAQTLAKLQDVPEIARVHNFFSVNGTAYIVMEYVNGITLQNYVRQKGGKLSPAETIAIMQPVIQAMARVHQAGMIHRDISPDNIMLERSGRVRLLDFGTARPTSSEQEATHSTQAVVKFGFAPMEQYQTRGNLGPWTDVYSLCATAYYCMTGTVPPEATSRVMGETNYQWQSIPGLSPHQAAALEKGTALAIQDRFHDMPSLGAALCTPAPAPIPGPAPAPQPIPETQPVYQSPVPPAYANPGQPVSPPVYPQPPKKEPRKGNASWILLAAICLVGVLVVFSRGIHFHSWEPATCSAPKTCPDCGETQGAPLGHKWQDATCTDPKTCTVCAETSGTPLGHDWIPATYETPDTCSRCGETQGDVLVMDGWSERNGATYYFEDGEPVTGFQTIGGTEYYFQEDGTLAKDTTLYDEEYGVTLSFDRYGNITEVIFDYISSSWSSNKYYLPDGNTTSYKETSSPVENCTSLDFCIEAEAKYGSDVSGDWDVYLRINGVWEKKATFYYSTSTPSTTIYFDTPITFDGFFARPKIRGTYSWSYALWIENVACLP